ncbi:MAG TPA: type II secretion system protein [Armatimonadota bacterium]|nr:type II secretion system protein [Armatimonadota bacterium]
MATRFGLRCTAPPAKRCGFTLIELLVVMSIIMVLASMLFPTFARARGVARQTVCISNLRQCGMALQLYQQDWEETMPAQDLSQLSGFFGATSPRTIAGPEDVVWIGQLYRYLKSSEVMRCKAAEVGTVDTFNGMPFGFGLNLELTYHCGPGGGSGYTWYGPKVSVLSAPTGAMMMADCSSFTFVQTPEGMMDVAYANAPAGTYEAGAIGSESHTRHVSGSNVLFADCHVKCYSPQRLLSEIPPLE